MYVWHAWWRESTKEVSLWEVKIFQQEAGREVTIETKGEDMKWNRNRKAIEPVEEIEAAEEVKAIFLLFSGSSSPKSTITGDPSPLDIIKIDAFLRSRIFTGPPNHSLSMPPYKSYRRAHTTRTERSVSTQCTETASPAYPHPSGLHCAPMESKRRSAALIAPFTFATPSNRQSPISCVPAQTDRVGGGSRRCSCFLGRYGCLSRRLGTT
jgi:hypothetical protein